MKKNACIVTGGAGFIGTALSNILPKSIPVVAIDNLNPQVHKYQKRPSELSHDVELIIGDITDPREWDQLLSYVHPKIVIHLAAETGTGQSLMMSSNHANVNVNGTAQMLDAFTRNKVYPEKILLASSRAVYGEGAWQSQEGIEFYPGQRTLNQLEMEKWDFENAEPIPSNAEKTWAKPVSIYGATKLAQEHVVAAWANSFNVSYKIFRFQNVYGPGQSLTNPYTGIIPLFVQIAKEGISIPLYEDGAMLRDFIYIDDVARAIAEGIASDSFSNSIIDVGTGQKTTLSDVANLIAERYHAPQPHVCGKYRYGDVRHASCVKPSSVTIKTDVFSGLSLLCDWIDETYEKM